MLCFWMNYIRTCMHYMVSPAWIYALSSWDKCVVPLLLHEKTTVCIFFFFAGAVAMFSALTSPRQMHVHFSCWANKFTIWLMSVRTFMFTNHCLLTGKRAIFRRKSNECEDVSFRVARHIILDWSKLMSLIGHTLQRQFPKYWSPTSSAGTSLCRYCSEFLSAIFRRPLECCIIRLLLWLILTDAADQSKRSLSFHGLFGMMHVSAV